MKNFVITIARQYGSGGRTVGEMLANKLGISYYDKDIIRMASDESGINERLFGNVDEHATGRPSLFSKAKSLYKGEPLYKGEVLPPQSKEFTSEENLFNIQAQTIKMLAQKESCVIIGRCSNYVLRDYSNVLSVFIHASHEYRMQEAAKKLSMNSRELEKFLKEDDKRKCEFSKRFTGREWTDARGYDLCLDSSKLGYDRCVEEIEAHLKLRMREE